MTKAIFALDHTDAAGRTYKNGAEHDLPEPQAGNLAHRGIVRLPDVPERKQRGRSQPPTRVPVKPAAKKPAAKTTTEKVEEPAPAGTTKEKKEGTGRG